MNETIRELHKRKSVRAFTEQPIAAEEKRAILEAAMAAPTAGNQQMYTILDITDEELKQRLSVSCDNQPFIAKAKLVLIFCADFQKWYDAFLEAGCEPRKPGVGDLMLSVTDTAIAAQNAVTAAESLGIGSCYIGDIMENCEIHREMLNLPDYVFPAVMVVFGYPTQQQIDRVKPERCALEDIVCENGYVRKDGPALRKMFAGKHPTMSYDEWALRFCNRKYNSDFSKEMGRSVGRYIRTFEPEFGQGHWCAGDDKTAPVITPRKQISEKHGAELTLPETALVFYMGRSMEHLYESCPEEWEEKNLPCFINHSKVYLHRSGRLCMLHGGYGSPQSADTVETLAALGVKRIIGVGMCGGYAESVAPGDLVLPDRAYVEEGASLHYYEEIEFAEPDRALLAHAQAYFPEAKTLPIVTTDAVFRQTFRKEALWREKGCVAVDMETSSMFSVARLRGMETVMLMTVSDRHPLNPEDRTEWKWHITRAEREAFAERCLAFAEKLAGKA